MKKYKNIERDFQYFLKNEKRFLRKYGNKHLVIKNKRVIGVFDNDAEAYIATVAKHKLGTFIIQECPHRVVTLINLGLFY
jgi:hypothetical protein